jgi:hypothetical protein
MQIKIEDFEKCLECWKTLYRLDDGIYKIILRAPELRSYPFWSSINFHPFPPLFMGGPSG